MAGYARSPGIVVGTALLAAATMLTGCGADDDGRGGATPTATVVATSTPAPTATAVAGTSPVPTPTFTATLAASSTRTPTSTPSLAPSATPTPSPTATATETAAPLDPNARGPYAVGSMSATFVRQSTTTQEPRALATVIWYPAPSGATGEAFVGGLLNAPLGNGGPFPLLVFSHGSCSIPQQSTFLTTLLATYGFIVAAPPHPGNTLLDGPPTLERCLGPANLVDSFVNRPDDIVFVIDQMLALSAGTTGALGGAVDGERIGVFGHSFGAQTALRVPTVDARVDAALSLAPGRTDLVQTDRITVPTMIQCGDIDSLVPFASCQATYDRLPGARFLLDILNTGHYAFANLCLSVTGSIFADCAPGTLTQDEAHFFVNRFAVPFFGRYVAGDERWTPLLEAGSEPQGVVYVADP